jgi:hypothetical protein
MAMMTETLEMNKKSPFETRKIGESGKTATI